MTDQTSHSPTPPGPIIVTSFGFGHRPAPQADIILDTRRQLRDPHHDPAMRYSTGLDPRVRDHVLATAGAQRLIDHTAEAAHDLLAQASSRCGVVVTVAVGCVGGRHRSVAIAEEIGVMLRGKGDDVEVQHRDLHLPVLSRQS